MDSCLFLDLEEFEVFDDLEPPIPGGFGFLLMASKFALNVFITGSSLESAITPGDDRRAYLWIAI